MEVNLFVILMGSVFWVVVGLVVDCWPNGV